MRCIISLTAANDLIKYLMAVPLLFLYIATIYIQYIRHTHLFGKRMDEYRQGTADRLTRGCSLFCSLEIVALLRVRRTLFEV